MSGVLSRSLRMLQEFSGITMVFSSVINGWTDESAFPPFWRVCFLKLQKLVFYSVYKRLSEVLILKLKSLEAILEDALELLRHVNISLHILILFQ